MRGDDQKTTPNPLDVEEFFGCSCGHLAHVLRVSIYYFNDGERFPDLFVEVIAKPGLFWTRFRRAWDYLWLSRNGSEPWIAETVLKEQDVRRLRDLLTRYLEAPVDRELE